MTARTRQLEALLRESGQDALTLRREERSGPEAARREEVARRLHWGQTMAWPMRIEAKIEIARRNMNRMRDRKRKR